MQAPDAASRSVPRALFTPVYIEALHLPNRIVMAPMTRCRAGTGNTPTPLMASYYRQRANAGLIITEATQVCQEGVGYPATPGMHTDEQVAGWRLVTREVHAAGGRIVLQLFHVGRISHPSWQPAGAAPVAPSPVKPEGSATTAWGQQPFVTPRALQTWEIPGVVGQFADAARRAKQAGFDGVEIHAANGYLIDQFLRDGTNHRTDRYGGSIENRIRFLLEVAEAISRIWGPARVGVRVSPTNPFNDMRDSDPVATFTAAAAALDAMRLGYLHVVEPWRPGATAGVPAPRTLPSIRTAFRGRLIVNGGYTPDAAEAAIVRGEADMVSFGTLFLANPDLVARVRAGAPLNEADPATFYGGGARGYTDYPTRDEAEGPAAA